MTKIIPLLLCALICACEQKENIAPEADEAKNENANTTHTDHSTRLEMPRLKGASSLFLVKEISGHKVNYCAEFDCALHSTRWVAFRWDVDNIVNRNVGRTDAWAEDEDIPEEFRVTLAEHKNDNYDRGHMLASEDRQNSKAANEQTFLLTNIFPQFNRFNGGNFVWVNMEKQARSFYKGWTRKQNAQDTLYVVKGGTIDDDSQILEKTPKGLLVPRYFYMAFLHKSGQEPQHTYEAMAFFVEHTDGVDRTEGNALKKYIISIDELERRTGIDFFCNLPDQIEEATEAHANPAAWGFK